MRCYFGVVLALHLVLSDAVMLVAEGAKARHSSDFEYDLNEEGSGVVIKKYKGKAKDVVIPSVYVSSPFSAKSLTLGVCFFATSINSVPPNA